MHCRQVAIGVARGGSGGLGPPKEVENFFYNVLVVQKGQILCESLMFSIIVSVNVTKYMPQK